MVELWLNRLNSVARLWNLSNWVARMDVRLWFGLCWLKKFVPKRPFTFVTWIDGSLLAKEKSWKRWNPQSMSNRALAPHCPRRPGRDLLWCLGKQGFAWKLLSFLSAREQNHRSWPEVWWGEIQPVQCWINEKFCFLRGTLTSSQP